LISFTDLFTISIQITDSHKMREDILPSSLNTDAVWICADTSSLSVWLTDGTIEIYGLIDIEQLTTQDIIDADRLNTFKNGLDRVRSIKMGFFMD